MSLEDTTATIRERVGEDCGLGATMKFDFQDDGAIFLDATTVPNVITNDNAADAQCTIIITLENFESMMTGSLDPMVAFGSGKLKVEGDIGVAMKLGTLMRG